MRRLTTSLAMLGFLSLGCAADEASSADDGSGSDFGGELVQGEERAVDLNPRATAPLPDGADLTRPLEVLFAPDDPVATMEATMIERVRRARLSDTRASLVEGQNPYRIRYAVYNIGYTVARQLASAARSGVDVQILTESDQLLPDRTWNTVDEYLVNEQGFEYVADHRRLTEATRRTADLVGVQTPGLMHLKTRIYETPEGATVLSGSFNPGESAVANEETFHLIREASLVARYQAMYDALLANRPIPNVWSDSAAVNVLFSPEGSGPRAAAQLLRWIEQENEQIVLMVFSLRDVSVPGAARTLVQLLGDKVRAGVPVWVITDRKQSDGVNADGAREFPDDRTEDRLRAVGVHVYEVINRATPFTAMHHKVAVLGRTRIRVVTDAANWSAAALGSARAPASNHESMLFIDSSRLDDGRTGQRYLGQWMRVLSRYAAQGAPDREPPFSQVFAALTALPGWPAQAVTFVAEQAMSEWGEGIYVRGDLDALSAWGTRGQGVALTTTAATYPTWTHATPISIPLGATFEWKLVAVSAQGVRWEPGANHADVAQPAALLPMASAVARAAWRRQ